MIFGHIVCKNFIDKSRKILGVYTAPVSSHMH